MKKELSSLTIAAIYIGTVVGAGFATGQELLQFFGFFGPWGIAGLLSATFMFILFGLSILELGRKLQARSHLVIVRQIGGKWLGAIIDFIITFFLFGAVIAMAAGAGAVFTEEFGFSSLWGSLAMIVFTALTVLLGLKGVITAVSFVVPFLLIAVLSISIGSIYTRFDNLVLSLLNFTDVQKAPIANRPLAAFLYVSYNFVLAVPILGPLGTLATAKTLRWGAILGGTGLGLTALAIDLSILANLPTALKYEVPMLYVAAAFPYLRLAFSLVLLAEVYTTAVTSLYSFIVRLTSPQSRSFPWLVISLSILAFAGAQLGFSNIVSTLFPTVGLAGFLLLGILAYGMVVAHERTPRSYPQPLVKPQLGGTEAAEELIPIEKQANNKNKR